MSESFGDVMRAHKGRKGKRRGTTTKCHIEKVRGGRYMLLCPHKRPRFVSEARAKAFKRR